MTAGVVSAKANEFRAVADNLLQDPELEDAFQLVRQARRMLASGVDSLLEAAETLGEEAHADYMEPDDPFWTRCDGEWSQGRGYKDRVVGLHRVWFEANQKIEAGISEGVEGQWQELLDRVAAILTDDEE